MACIAEATSGFPNANGHIPFECATIAEVLGERGWNTYMLGKWHLVAADEMNMASTKRNWPVGRGFERYYGFLGGETNQWYPDLVYDNHLVEQPAMPEDGYHLTTDLTDKAIEFIKDAKMIVPDKPFFMYFCPGATHAPHHAPKEWIERYRGRFDMGYERYREQVFQRQQQLGIFPEDAELSPLNPYAEETERRRQAVERRSTWCGPGTRSRRRSSGCSAGWPRCTPGSCPTPTTRSGACSTSWRQSGELENTIVMLVSDNGASGEGGPNGSVNENKFFNGIPDDIQENLRVSGGAGLAGHLQPLPGRLGVGVQHPVQDVEALQLRRRRGRPAAHLLAQADRGQGRAAPPVRPRHRPGARPSTTASGSSCRRWSRASPRSRWRG